MADESSRIRSVFLAAIEHHAPEEWPGFLNDACADDPALRDRVERLLRAQAQLGSFHEERKPSLVVTIDEPMTERPGTVLGSYKLMEQIGEGGMGLVFVAEQQQPIRRKVALKVIKPGMDTREVIARFEAERQALALMDHPNIAKVYDGGTTQTGRPYFVMELVKGVSITDFCDRERLTTRQRLGLFVSVCQAVQHAHQKGIIHRDLKPSNILVTVHDVTPVVKVIDFGVAKATGQQLTDRTVYTAFAQLVGTPLYMSPEQAGLSGLDVDTRSDIYSLGVLLYKLLTGTTPFDQEVLHQASHDEMRRMIREDEPPRPSTRLSTLAKAELSTLAERRGVEPRQLRQEVRGELDWVVMKCLEKDRNRRYETASALAADVQRFLDDEPVTACPPTVAYRLRKLWRRNRGLLATAAVVTTVLMAATAVSVWQAVEAREAQRKAEDAEGRAITEGAIARAVNDFLQQDLLKQAASVPEPGFDSEKAPYLTVKEALDRAAARIGQRFQEQPLVEAAIRTAIGAAYNNLEENQHAVIHLERAFAMRKARLGLDHQDTQETMYHFANACSGTGRHADAISLIEQLLEQRKNRLGIDHAETLASVGHLAAVNQHAGNWNTSVQLWEQLLEKRRAIRGPNHADTLRTMHSLATNYAYMNRLAEAITLHEKVMDHLTSKTNSERSRIAIPSMGAAVTYQRAGKYDLAERMLRELLAQYRKQDDSLTARIGIASSLGWLARNLLFQKRYSEAEPIAREALSIFKKERPDDPRGLYWESVLGSALSGQRRYAEAEPLLLRGYEGMKEREGFMDANWRSRLVDAGERIVHFYEETGKREKANEWRQRLPRAVGMNPTR